MKADALPQTAPFLFISGVKTPVGNPGCALKKSKYLLNRAGDCRFLDGFQMRVTGSGSGRPGLVNKKIRN